MKSVTARVPLRISFAGGGTDVEPYSSKFGGEVLAGTIGLYVEVTVRSKASLGVSMLSIDTGFKIEDVEFLTEDALKGNLLTACLSIIPNQLRGFVSVTVKSPVPPRSGLGASSAIVLAVTAGLLTFFDIPFTKKELAEKAYLIERVMLGIPGGCQDQYVCAFGSLNRFKFDGFALSNVEPVSISQEATERLSAQCILVWTGLSRNSSLVIEDAARNSVSHDKIQTLHAQKSLVKKLHDLIQSGEIDKVGQELTRSWELKKSLSPLISSEAIDSIFGIGMRLGAYGGKLLGAGGGGYVLFIAPGEEALHIAEEFSRMGFTAKSISFESGGINVEISG